MRTLQAVFWAAIGYAILLVVVRTIFSSEAIPAVTLAGIPLIVVALVIARDLSRRSTVPTVPRTTSTNRLPRENPVEFLSDQLSIAASASNSYFENVVRARLRQLLTMKVALETGMENDMILRILSDPIEGRRLLHDDKLYNILYGQLPETREVRAKMIEGTMDMIGAWTS